MPRAGPHIAELAYEEYCRYSDTPHCAYRQLPMSERIAWGMASLAAVKEACRLRLLAQLAAKKRSHFVWPDVGREVRDA